MHSSNDESAGVTCDNWYLGIYCDCLDCKVLMDDALQLNGALFDGEPHHQRASLFSPVGQNAPIDPLLLNNNEAPVPSLAVPPNKNNSSIAKPSVTFPAQQQIQSLYNPLLHEPTNEDLSNALGLGSPFQETRPLRAQKQKALENQYPDPSASYMLPMPQLHSPDPDFAHHGENAAASRGLNSRSRAPSFATNASSPAELYSPNLYGTPAATPREDQVNTPSLHLGSSEYINNSMESNRSTRYPQRTTRRLRNRTNQTTTATTTKNDALHATSPLSLPPPSLPSVSPELSTSALSPSQDPETAYIMAQQKPKPLSITPDMSDAEKARLCEANDAIFAERLRIQRAKNNCAAKKSRQRRLDLIRDLQAENSNQRSLIEELGGERDDLKEQMDRLNRQIAELQSANAELLRDKVAAQREVMGAASLQAERDGLREDLRHQQGLVQSLMMRLTAGGGGGGGGAGGVGGHSAAVTSAASSANNP